ncbi:hypothetical protein [Streptosporangium carneum]|uniref:Uncharacterized protein n=1 Tax=Streptosporangium carneum TaxID=47481 RepID=A0A9W6I3S0_9ACTN|nr:hypothetical protein [Streptosporangium carneum]GLK11122.1 hypothetical protein GCM10017600_45280 [Streptosporangium carneum]
MGLIDRECVRRLLEAPDPGATLVFVQGDCMVLPDGEINDHHRPLIIARRYELTEFLGGETATDQQLDMLADRLDNVARDLAD